MTRNEQIREALKKLSGEVGPLQTLLATVLSVDADEYTCVVSDEDIEIADVRLRPVLNGEQSITLFPKVGSFVLIIRLEDDAEWMVLAADEIDSYRIKTGNMIFEMKNGKFNVESGAETLGKCIDDLIIEIQAIFAPKNTAAITAIQLRFKQLLSGT